MALPSWFTASRLWLVLDEVAAAPHSLLEAARQGLAGGVDVVVFRHRHAPVREVLELGKPVRQLCRELKTPFVLSHYPELARELQPDAVNLGTNDPPLDQVRRIVGQGIALGFSSHAPEESAARLDAGIDYCILGPIYATPEKLKYGPPLGLDAVHAAAAMAERLVFIGGISAANVDAVLAAGAQRVAVISAIQRAQQPTVAARELKLRLSSVIG